MIVLGHRVLIQPDPQPDATDSGLILTQDREYVATSGTVVQVGPGGSKLRYDARQRAIQACLDTIADGDEYDRSRLAALLGSADPDCDVHVGDRVAFDGDTGLSVVVDDTPYLILNMDDVVVIIAEAEEAA